jgi:alpha-1,2-mannosyltransferase
MEGIAVTALLGVLLSPVSWIHHFLVVVVVIGAILADGRSRQRVAIAAGTGVFFALTIPWWGRSLLAQPGVPALVARVVEDGFGITAVALVVILARLPAVHAAVPRLARRQPAGRRVGAAGVQRRGGPAGRGRPG